MSTFFPQNICLGDILKNSGYENYFVQGANLRFAGKDVFLKSHGFDHLYGSEELKTTVADPSYRNDWGFYDDTVLDETWKKFEELSRAGKRFSLFALTVDTHHPDGFVSRTCKRKSYDVDGKNNTSFSAVTCSQEHIAALVEKIKASPWFKNTVIVVSSDHLAMKNSAWDRLNKQDRSNLFFVLRGDQPQQEVIATKRNSMDNGATVLDILGGDNFIGLGRSTLSGQSLSEVFLNMKDKILAWKPDIIRLWNFPKEMKDFTVDRDKNTIAFSGSSFRLPLLVRVSAGASSRCRKANIPRRCAISWPILPHAIISSGSTDVTKWASSGRSRWRFLPTGASLRVSSAGSKPYSTWIKPSGKAKPRLTIR
jgi:phosphoglycerol transferase